MDSSESGQGSVCYPHYHHEPQHYCTAIRSIDTVRALHQTVVSLRTALDESKREIEKLKKQIDVNSEIQDGRQCQHSSELSREQQQTVDYKVLGDKVSELEKIYFRDHPHESSTEHAAATPEEKNNQTFTSTTDDANKDDIRKSSSITNLSLVPNITVSTQNLNETATGCHSTATMASRIDVKIKVSSNINVESNDTMSETSSSAVDDCNDTKAPHEADDEDEKDEHKETHATTARATTPRVEVEMFEDSRANKYTIDASNVKICITSEESVNITSSRKSNSINQTSTEYLNLDIDDISEGDNSVFTEGATTPIEQRMRQVDEEIDSEDEVAMGDDGELPREVEKEENEIPEEVDDIELIFSADDNKDGMQDDLVSLSEYEPWNETNEDGTPVLTKFATITSDDLEREAYYERKRALKAARTKEKLNSRSIESAGGRDMSLDSTNSSFDNTNNKFTSFERDSNGSTSRPSASGSYSFGRRHQPTHKPIETDISKIGVTDENMPEMSRRNTCPNPPLYRPLSGRSNFRSPNLAAKFPRTARGGAGPSLKSSLATNTTKPVEGKSTSSVQTDISALPHQWRSETQLSGGAYCLSGITLPSTSKFNSQRNAASRCGKNTLKLSEKTQEARRVLLSDINFTSMVPELSRSADHLCQQKINEESNNDEIDDYYKGNNLKAPDDFTRAGITPSSSMIASPGVSQWTVNESTTQTEQVYWHEHADSFDSSKCYSLRNSTNLLGQHNRSKSVPSIRCSICKQNHSMLKPSESMNYSTKMVTFQEPMQKIRGSLPDLRHDCCCARRYCGRQSIVRMHESSGSTESLLDEADEFLRADSENKKASRRCSEADALRDFHPPKHSLPFLPKTAKCLKTGQLAKVIAKTGRVVVGRIRYCGPVADADDTDETYVGLQLPSALGDCDGSFGGRKFFECEQNFGMFVPFKKVIMAWNS